MAGAVQTMTIKKDEMARKSTTGFTTATEIADTIVRATGLPFRTAHGIVGRLARGSGNPSLKDVDGASMEMIGKKVSAIGLTAKMLAEAKDPVANVERRNILGGPAKATVRKKIDAERKKLASDSERMSSLGKGIETAYAALSKAADGITGKRK
jgi:argininosuccinate lyase